MLRFYSFSEYWKYWLQIKMKLRKRLQVGDDEKAFEFFWNRFIYEIWILNDTKTFFCNDGNDLFCWTRVNIMSIFDIFYLSDNAQPLRNRFVLSNVFDFFFVCDENGQKVSVYWQITMSIFFAISAMGEKPFSFFSYRNNNKFNLIDEIRSLFSLFLWTCFA